MYLGIDIGTQSLKAVICDDRLQVRGVGASPYQPSFPRPAWSEQDPRLWEDALGPAIAAALHDAGIRGEAVTALGIAGQLDGCVPVGADGAAQGPALIWMDRRAEAETLDIDPALILERAGLVLDATHMAAKIRWLRREGPAGTVLYHQPVSYMVARLTGAHFLDHGLASTTMLYGLHVRSYDERLLECFQISPSWLPPLAEASATAGTLNAQGAEMTGLPAGIPVAVGTGDDFSNPLGAGLARPGRLVCALGTAEVVGALHPQPLIDSRALVETHAYAGGQFFLENPGWLSGGALTWFIATHRLADPAELDALAQAVPPGAGGATFLPALSGAMAPQWIAGARGAYYGLTPAHDAGHMGRAVLEGCAFAMRDVLERLLSLGLEVGALLLVGGGAKSQLWAQIRADLTGLPVEIPRHLDSSPIGAAILAAVACGDQPSVPVAAGLVGHVARTVAPQPAHKGAYDEAYGRYRQLFECLRPRFTDES